MAKDDIRRDLMADDREQLLRKIAKLEVFLTAAKRKQKKVYKALELADERLSFALAIGPDKDVLPKPMNPPKRSSRKRKGCAIAVASDWHWAEEVRLEQVNGLNEYNLDIARTRGTNFFRGFRSLIELCRKGNWQVDDAVLALLGDMMTGYLREEDLESNFLSPVEEIDALLDFLAEGIQYILKECGIKRLRIPCTHGNHGRTTPRPRTSTSAKNSYEWLMYQRLSKMLKKDKRVEFYVARGLLLYQKVYGIMIRWHHGDYITYRGGIQGLGVPMAKKISRWNMSKHADLTCIGHYHQYGWYGLGACTNGSLIGWNDYALSIGASPEPPMQAFFLIDSEQGIALKAPIWVKNR